MSDVNAPSLTGDRPYSDSFANALTGLATSADKSTRGFFAKRPRLASETLENMYEQSALSARIVDRVVDDGTREGFEIKGTDEEFDFASVQSELEDLDALNEVGDAWRWSRLYGGALLVMITADGKKMDQPLNLDNVRKLVALHVVESSHITPVEFNPGLGSRAFRRPKYYEITVPIGDDANLRRIHWSRVIRFDGIKVPPSRRILNNGWGPSVLDRVYTEIAQLGESMGYSRNILHDIALRVYKIDGLREQLCGSAQSAQEVRQVLELLTWSIDNLHALTIDAKDAYQEVNRTVTGIVELVREFIDAMVRATDMPRTVLLGAQTTGLNADADAEIRAWYDNVKSQQKMKLTPALNRLLEVLFAARKNSTQESVPTEWTIEYNALWQPSEGVKAETENKQAQTDSIYITEGVYTADHVTERLQSEGRIPELDSEPEETDPESIAAVEAALPPARAGEMRPAEEPAPEPNAE
jgi:phage-related protein (TIGR01555 family)